MGNVVNGQPDSRSKDATKKLYDMEWIAVYEILKYQLFQFYHLTNIMIICKELPYFSEKFNSII